MAYQKHVEYHFTVMGDAFALSFVSEKSADIRETRCNGQEDTHFSDYVYTDDDGNLAFEVGDWFEDYGRGEEQKQAVLDYIKENGFPV